MHTLPNIFKRVLAAVMFFTRLPLGRRVIVESRYFERVVPLWPLAGWLTGGLMAGVFLLARRAGLAVELCVIAALASRVLLTGALHEDGLADFFDGFGGGRTPRRTLDIMKDSHIGTYGVLGLIFYVLTALFILSSLMERGVTPLVFIVGDAACKFLASTIVWFLPYVRREEEAKNRVVYTVPTVGEKAVSLLLGILPLAVFMVYGQRSGINGPSSVLIALGASALCCALLFLLMRRRIGGYTGDCCGAVFLLSELTFYLSFLAVGC